MAKRNDRESTLARMETKRHREIIRKKRVKDKHKITKYREKH